MMSIRHWPTVYTKVAPKRMVRITGSQSRNYQGQEQKLDTKISLCMRKPTIWVSDQVQHKPGCTVKEDDKRQEILDLESRGIVLSV